MEIEVFHMNLGPSESYSRQLDKMVAAQEMPYGYHFSPPPAGHENHEAREQRFKKRNY